MESATRLKNSTTAAYSGLHRAAEAGNARFSKEMAATASFSSNDLKQKFSRAGSSISGTFGKLGGSIKNMFSSLAGSAKGVLGPALAIGGAFAIDKMVTSAARFQKEMLLVQTQAGATAAEVKRFTPAILAMAGPLGTSADALSLSLYHVESVTHNAAIGLNIVRVATMGAKIGDADLEQTTNALTSAVASGIPGVKNMAQAMGVLNATVGAGDMKLSDLNAALSTGMLSVVKAYGLSLRDVGAALATFGDLNVRGAGAATALRMGVQALAVPIKGGKTALEAMGMSMTTLTKDMQTGGLNKALMDLHDHLTKAGITGDRVGQKLTEIFGKRAGTGIILLMTNLDRLHQKYGQIDKAAGSFGADWAATTKTTAFHFDRLKQTVEAAGISIGLKLLPYLSKAADWLSIEIPKAIQFLTPYFKKMGDWLSVNLPKAISALKKAFGTLQLYFSGPLHTVFDALVGALKTVWTILGNVAGVISRNQGTFKTFASVVAGIWLAFKLWAGIELILDGVAAGVEAIMAAGSLAEFFSFVTPLGAALTIAGAAVGLFFGAWLKHKDVLAAQKANVDSLTASINADNGALTTNTKLNVETAIRKAGAPDAARTLGFTPDNMHLLTDAAMGNVSAMKQVKAIEDAAAASLVGLDNRKKADYDRTQAVTKAIRALNSILGGETTAVNKATQAYKDQQALLGITNDITANLTTTFKKNKNSIDAKTAAGRQDINLVKQDIPLIGAHALSIFKLTGSTQQATQAFHDDVAVLRDHLIKLTGNKTAVDKLLTSLGLIKPGYKTGVTVDTSQADNAIQVLLDKILLLQATALGIASTLNSQVPGLPGSSVQPYKGKPPPKGKKPRASGGPVVAGGVYPVNERGYNEVFIPSVNGHISPTHKPMGGGGSSGSLANALNGMTFHLIFDGPSTARMVAKHQTVTDVKGVRR